MHSYSTHAFAVGCSPS